MPVRTIPAPTQSVTVPPPTLVRNSVTVPVATTTSVAVPMTTTSVVQTQAVPVPTTVQTEQILSINGRLLNGRPQHSGLYINAGRIVVVK